MYPLIHVHTLPMLLTPVCTYLCTLLMLLSALYMYTRAHPCFTRISPVYTYVTHATHHVLTVTSECIVVVPVLQHCRCGMLCSCTHGITGYSRCAVLGGTRVHTLI